MHRFFIEDEDQILDQQILIENQDSYNHMVRVLRVKEGEACELIGKEKTYIGKVATIEAGQVVFDTVDVLSHANESPVDISLFQGIPKGQKMELIIQKNVELGVNQFYLLDSKRCVVKLKGKDISKKLDRYNKIAKEAAKQSKRDQIPQVTDVINLKQFEHMASRFDLIILLYEAEQTQTLKETLEGGSYQKIALIIGPEGGFEEAEVKQLEDMGAISVRLGKRILRTETAGFVAVSNIQYAIGDLNTL